MPCQEELPVARIELHDHGQDELPRQGDLDNSARSALGPWEKRTPPEGDIRPLSCSIG